MRFLIDNIHARMCVGNAVEPMDTSALASNINFVFFDSAGGLGAIQHTDRPSSLEDITDPSPYQPFVNTWLALAAADTPPLTLAQAIAIKAAFVQVIYNVKRAALVTGAVGSGLLDSVGGTTAPGVWNSPLQWAFSAGNTQASLTTTQSGRAVTLDTAFLNGNKYYWEVKVTTSSIHFDVGVITPGSSLSGDVGAPATGYSYQGSGQKENNGSSSSYGSSYTNGALHVIGVALDLVNDAIWFSLDGVWQNGATAAQIAAGNTSNAAFTGLSASSYYGAVSNGATGNAVTVVTNPSAPYTYTPPSGFGPLAGATFPADDVNAITNNAAGIGATAGGTSATFVTTTGTKTVPSNQVSGILTAVATVRETLTTAYFSILAGVNACASIAAVIAFDVTAGWP